MRVRAALVCVTACAVVSVVSVVAQQPGAPPPPATPLPWAYPLNPPAPAAGRGAPAPAAQQPDSTPRKVPGSAVEFTQVQLRDLFNVPDWHPGSHPAMPGIVSTGRRPDVRACGFCHLPNGQGRPENASLAGLPAAYIEQQMEDYRAGLRRSSEPRMGPPALMLTIGKAATAEESAVAAAYFAAVPYKKWIRVVEQNVVPRTRVQGGMLIPDEGGGTEPIGQRIIEMPENLERTELRDSASGFVAYVPEGSITRGQALVTSGGNGRTVACVTCHGADLKGLGPVPPLAGRSPSYTVRQLWDLQRGNRNGLWAPLMKAAVEKLTVDDLVAIAAYTASREP
jgi:cytochrome c553